MPKTVSKFLHRYKILQANIHHAIAASNVIETVLKNNRIDIALIQEPWINNDTIRGLNISGYELIYNTSVTKPRACILIKRKIDFVGISEYWTADLVAIQVKTKDEEVIIATAYMPGEESVAPTNEVKKLIQYSKQTKKPLLIGADCNAHHTVWGSTDINSRGECLLEYLIKEDLYTLNVGNKPTFETINRKEVLDITIGNRRIKENVKKWQVSDEISLFI